MHILPVINTDAWDGWHIPQRTIIL